METLTAIEQFGAVEALKRSFFVYPLVNAVHILAIGALVTSVVLMDLRVIGFFREVRPGIPIGLLRRIALGAFAFAALTGLSMFAVRATEYVTNPAFLLKMALIPLAALNFFAFLGLTRKSPDEALPAAKAGAALSILLWLTIALCGRFIGFL